MLAETFTDGFLVIRDGAVVTERYLAGMRETDTHLLMSCSKSLTSILCGVLAGRGLLTSDDLVTDHLPELTGTAWEGCRLQHILDMRAGNAWDYDVDEYTILDVSDYRTHDRGTHHPARHGDVDPDDRSRPARPRQRAVSLSLARHRRPRRALERAGGAAFPELFSREVWSRIGAEQDAQIMLDALGIRHRRGRHLHDAARSRPLRADVPRRRLGARGAGRPGRLDRARAGTRSRADRRIPRLSRCGSEPSPTPSTTTSGGCTTAPTASTRRSA